MARIGLFGGSFNPIHSGHINLAVSVMEKLMLDKVIFIPSGLAPHKSSSEYADSADRLEMCRLATEEYESFEVSDYEINKSGKSYSVYTVEHFRKIFPDDELFLMVGSDMLLTFDTWFRYEDILKNAVLAAVSRNGNDFDELYKMTEKLSDLGRIVVVNNDAITISSSKIRKMIKNNEDISCYLNGKVVKYIILKNLYSKQD